MTPSQHTILRNLSDGDWQLGAAVTDRGNTLGTLWASGFVRYAGQSDGYLHDSWQITPSGTAALEAKQ